MGVVRSSPTKRPKDGLVKLCWICYGLRRPQDAQPGRQAEACVAGRMACGRCVGLMANFVLLLEIEDGTAMNPLRTGRLAAMALDNAWRCVGLGTARVAYITATEMGRLALDEPQLEVSHVQG